MFQEFSIHWVRLSELSATLCWTALYVQWIPLTKGNLILAFVICIIILKRTDHQMILYLSAVVLALPLLPSSCCFDSVNREGRYDRIAWSLGSWSSPKPNSPKHLGLIASCLVSVDETQALWGALCWQSPGATIKLLFQQDVPLERPSNQKFPVLLDKRWTPGYLLLEESLDYSRPTVPQCTQTVILRGKAVTLMQDRRHEKQVGIFA